MHSDCALRLTPCSQFRGAILKNTTNITYELNEPRSGSNSGAGIGWPHVTFLKFFYTVSGFRGHDSDFLFVFEKKTKKNCYSTPLCRVHLS